MAASTILHVHEHFNPEEAAHAASEFVGSLDNLPGEVTFLLEEIREKDIRINQLLTRINNRHVALTRHARNTTTSAASTATFPLPIPPGAPIPSDHLSNKDAIALSKVQAEWVKVDILQDEKIKLAERMERIVNRARVRGISEWKKVGGMDLEEIEGENGRLGFGELGSGEVMLPPGGLGSGIERQRKRKPTALAIPSQSSAYPGHITHPPSSIHPPPSHVPSTRHTASGRAYSRSARRRTASELSEDDAADAERDGDEEVDDTLYCTCQQKSYEQMIGCDNGDKCEFEWFHIKCVDLAEPPPEGETWYCPPCTEKMGLNSDGRRREGGRDKKARRR